MLTLRRLLLLVIGLIVPARAMASVTFLPDSGSYAVYRNERFLGAEHFQFQARHDSAIVFSRVRELLPRGALVDTLRKDVVQLRSVTDGDLKSYQSQQVINRSKLMRKLVMDPDAYTSYREENGVGGFGDRYERPPGRIYVVDPQVFALVEVICRDMHAQKVDERPITLLYVTSRDTSVEGRVKRLGHEPVQIGKQRIMAEKLSITDPWSTAYAWVSPRGRMLRLTVPDVGLRVERSESSLRAARPAEPALSRASTKTRRHATRAR